MSIKDDFWHLDGKHRTNAPTANGRDVTRFEFGIREHLESCAKVPQETTNADDIRDTATDEDEGLS